MQLTSDSPEPTNDMLERLRNHPDRHHELILLARKVYRLAGSLYADTIDEHPGEEAEHGGEEIVEDFEHEVDGEAISPIEFAVPQTPLTPQYPSTSVDEEIDRLVRRVSSRRNKPPIRESLVGCGLRPGVSWRMKQRRPAIMALERPQLASTTPGGEMARDLQLNGVTEENGRDGVDECQDGGDEKAVATTGGAADEHADAKILSPIDFLTGLAPGSRATVISIVNTLADAEVLSDDDEEEDFPQTRDAYQEGADMEDGLSTRSHLGYAEEEDLSWDGHTEEDMMKMAEEITFEFAVRTGRAVAAPALIRRVSRTWAKEAHGRQDVEADYNNVIGFLRML